MRCLWRVCERGTERKPFLQVFGCRSELHARLCARVCNNSGCVYSIGCVLEKSSNRPKAATLSIMHCFLRCAAADEVLTKEKEKKKSYKIKPER